MSQNIDNQEPVIEPTPLYEEETVVVKKKKKNKAKYFVWAGGAIFLLVGFSVLSGSDQEVAETTIVPPPSLDTTVGGGVSQNSAEYADRLRQANDQNAQAALESGVTFIPTPENALAPIETTVEVLPEAVVVEEEPEPESAAVVERKRPVIPQLRKVNETPTSNGAQTQTSSGPAQQQQQEENPYTALMAGHMGALSGVYAPKTTGTEDYAIVEDEPEEPAQESGPEVASENSQDPLMTDETAPLSLSDLEAQRAQEVQLSGADNVVDEPARSDEKVFIAAGDMMYGEVIATVNSDAEMPVIVNVTTGPYKGARLRGTFATDNVSGKMVVSFSQMTNGNVTIPVSALAVDGYTADSSVRSGIERRYLKRYGTVFATTFVAGLAEGLSEPEKTIISDENGNDQVVEEPRTTEESLWNGVNNAVGVINGDILASRPQGPKIYLHSGYPVGILFVDDVRENPSETDKTP